MRPLPRLFGKRAARGIAQERIKAYVVLKDDIRGIIGYDLIK